MIFILFFLFTSISATIFHETYESNNICGNSAISISTLLPQYNAFYDNVLYYVSVAIFPSNGNLYTCLDHNVCEQVGSVVTTITYVQSRNNLHTPFFIYIGNPDFYGIDTFYLHILRRDFTPSYYNNDILTTVLHTVNVIPMPSVPLQNGTDLDGTSIVQTYTLLINDCIATFEHGFNGSCINDECIFDSISTQYANQLSKLSCVDTRLLSLRAYIRLLGKPQFSNVCPQYIQNSAYWSHYIDIDTGIQDVPMNVSVKEIHPGWTAMYSINNPPLRLGSLVLNENYTLEFLRKDSITYNTELESNCILNPTFTISNGNISVPSIFLAEMPIVKWSFCVLDKQHLPLIYPLLLTNIWESTPIAFSIVVVDFNDQTQGLDNGIYSTNAFRRKDSTFLFVTGAGVSLSQTVFDNSVIKRYDCTGSALTPNLVYQTLDFCYITSGPSNAIIINATVIDGNGGIGIALIEFSPTIQVSVCDATNNTSLDSLCTSQGKESNDLFGSTLIPIVPQLIVYPDQVNYGVVFVIESLPLFGSLYTCGNVDCSIVGNDVTVGERYVYLPPKPLLVYIGNPDYFNMVIYSMVANPAGVQDFYSFVDRKNISINGCPDTDNGCPDSFNFHIEHPLHPTIQGSGQYNIYVENIGSNIQLIQDTYNEREPWNFYSSNIPRRIGTTLPDGGGLTYNDPDGDTWTAELVIITTMGYVGDIIVAMNNYSLELIPVQTDCRLETDNSTRYCGGSLVFRGLPSDIKAFIENDLWFIYWPYIAGVDRFAYNDLFDDIYRTVNDIPPVDAIPADNTYQEVYISIQKRYTTDKYSALNYLETYYKDVLEEYETQINSCLIPEPTRNTPTPTTYSPTVPGFKRVKINNSPLFFLYTTHMSSLPIMTLDNSKVYIPGYYGDDTTPYVPLSLPNLTFVDCYTSTIRILDFIRILQLEALNYPTDDLSGRIYMEFGGSSIYPIASRIIKIQISQINSYTVTSSVASYLFRWDNNENSEYRRVVRFPLYPPPHEFWAFVGDQVLAGALTDPSPQNIALAILNLALLLLDIPPIGALASFGLRGVTAMATGFTQTALRIIVPALTRFAEKGLIRFATTPVRLVIRGVSRSVVFVVTSSRDLIVILGKLTKTAITRVGSEIRQQLINLKSFVAKGLSRIKTNLIIKLTDLREALVLRIRRIFPKSTEIVPKPPVSRLTTFINSITARLEPLWRGPVTKLIEIKSAIGKFLDKYLTKLKELWEDIRIRLRKAKEYLKKQKERIKGKLKTAIKQLKQLKRYLERKFRNRFFNRGMLRRAIRRTRRVGRSGRYVVRRLRPLGVLARFLFLPAVKLLEFLISGIVQTIILIFVTGFYLHIWLEEVLHFKKEVKPKKN
jgi:hypothetical protein